MKITKVFLAAVVIIALASSALAAPTPYIGSDPGATGIGSMPNSIAAAVSWDTAVGSFNLIDFESQANGAIQPGLNLGFGVTLNSSSSGAIMSGGSGFELYGGNTTVAGSKFASVGEFPNGTFTFSFSNPVDAFGAYFSGLQGNVVGQETITYDNGGTQTVNIPNMGSTNPNTGGAAFVGFTDAGASIVSILINFNNDVVGMDDVRIRTVPEPATMLLLGLGLVGLAGVKRKLS